MLTWEPGHTNIMCVYICWVHTHVIWKRTFRAKSKDTFSNQSGLLHTTVLFWKQVENLVEVSSKIQPSGASRQARTVTDFPLSLIEYEIQQNILFNSFVVYRPLWIAFSFSVNKYLLSLRQFFFKKKILRNLSIPSERPILKIARKCTCLTSKSPGSFVPGKIQQPQCWSMHRVTLDHRWTGP